MAIKRNEIEFLSSIAKKKKTLHADELQIHHLKCEKKEEEKIIITRITVTTLSETNKWSIEIILTLFLWQTHKKYSQ